MTQSKTIQSIRGMRDIFPPQSLHYDALIGVIKSVLHQYGFAPIQLPLLEKTDLFQRTIGEETDIVSKEMYTFLDRNAESLTLRPEGTAGVVRAMIENGLLQQVSRFYLEGAMFRYERPQKGRYRQFNQFSVEIFGVADAMIDVELILVGAAIYKRLGVLDLVTLELNTIGLPEERRAFEQALVAYLRQHFDALDADCKRRLDSNPLRILDSKNPAIQTLLNDAPTLSAYLGEQSQQHFAKVCATLDELGVAYVLNERLVRGLDYYCHTVFEWTTTELGAQGTVCAGGRYDGLVEQLGGKATPALGFGLGLDRTLLLAQTRDVFTEPTPWLYAIAAKDAWQGQVLALIEALRQHFEEKMIIFQAEVQSLKAQLKKADRSQAKWALIVGDAEAADKTVTLKNLNDGQQHTLPQAQLSAWLAEQES